MTNILIFLLINLCIFYVFLKILLKYNEVVIKELEEKKKILLENNELHDKNLIHSVIEQILLLKLTAFANDYQKFTEIYQHLYFLGIKKEILDDSNLLDDFLSNLINNKFDIKPGEKPFMLDFSEKK